MKLDDLLKHQSLILPKNWKTLGYSSYYECVNKEGRNFLKLLEKLEDSEDYGKDKYIGTLSKNLLISSARAFYIVVTKTLKSYLNEGNPHKAYNVLSDGLIKPNKETSTELLKCLEFNHLYPVHYRLRSIQGNVTLKDLFHVPFELRHTIGSNRYSIPGHPTLYFSNSIYLAYQELGQPDYDNLYVSKFDHTRYFNNSETLLDMTNKPLWNTPDAKFKFIARWILTMACSIKVGFPNSPFKPEYILPQIIFQWVKNNINIGSRRIIGVTYSSTKIVDDKKGFKGYFYNTAIPIHHSNKEGFCDVLTKQFFMTQPIKFNDALSVNKETSIQGQVKSIELNGVPVEYEKTDFGKIEQVLSETPYSTAYNVNDTR